jgi:hypothetical protein
MVRHHVLSHEKLHVLPKIFLIVSEIFIIDARFLDIKYCTLTCRQTFLNPLKYLNTNMVQVIIHTCFYIENTEISTKNWKRCNSYFCITKMKARNMFLNIFRNIIRQFSLYLKRRHVISYIKEQISFIKQKLWRHGCNLYT